jgi:adenylate cyclase
LRSQPATTTQAERQLAAVVAADIAGYSRLMGADEEGTLARLKACRRDLIDPGIARHRGRIVKTTGDGLLVEFSSPVEAVRWAVEMQHGMIERNADVPDDGRIHFRVGINLGDVIVDDKDLYGDAVNIAARLENLAEPGGICISRTVREQIRDRLALPFEDGGEQSVKNIARPIRVYALTADAVAALPKAEVPAAPRPAIQLFQRRNIAVVALAGVLIIAGGLWCLWWLWPSPKAPSATVTAPAAAPAVPSRAPRLSIVVLPFANLSNDPEQQYFADGVTEDLTTDLSRVSHSLVISRNTAFTYKDKPVNTKRIGRELGVRYVLEGSVQRLGKQVRVNAQLIDAETDAHLWAERFNRDIGDRFALQNEITGRIANTLNAELISAEAARPTENPDALDYILRGRAAWSEGPTRDNYAQAISLFERALALDPGSVEAQSQLAGALAARVNGGRRRSTCGPVRESRKFAQNRALIPPARWPCADRVTQYRPPPRARNRPSFLRHPGLAQTDEIRGFEEGADLRHHGSFAHPENAGGLQAGDARITAVASPPGFGECGGGAFGVAFECIGGGASGVRVP